MGGEAVCVGETSSRPSSKKSTRAPLSPDIARGRIELMKGL
jgi:hypothetical protein